MFLQHRSMAFKIIEFFKKKDSLEMLKDWSKEALKMCNLIRNDRDFFWCEDPEKYWPSWRR